MGPASRSVVGRAARALVARRLRFVKIVDGKAVRVHHVRVSNSIPTRLPRQTTLDAALAILVEIGPVAFLADPGIGPLSRSLLEGHLTIWPEHRAAYGDETVWTAWETLRAEHGDRLRALLAAEDEQGERENDLLCEAIHRAAEPCSWQ